MIFAIPVRSGKTCIDLAKNNPIDNPAPIENKHIVPVRMNGELSCSDAVIRKKMSVVVNIKPSPVLLRLRYSAGKTCWLSARYSDSPRRMCPVLPFGKTRGSDRGWRLIALYTITTCWKHKSYRRQKLSSSLACYLYQKGEPEDNTVL